MTVFRLYPIKLSDPAWGISTIREMIWVNAETPDQARKIVSYKTMTIKSGASVLQKSPWVCEWITGCDADPTKENVPEDTVIDAKGRDVYALHRADTISGAFEIYREVVDADLKSDKDRLLAITQSVATEIGGPPVYITKEGHLYLHPKLKQILEKPGNRTLLETLVMGSGTTSK